MLLKSYNYSNRITQIHSNNSTKNANMAFQNLKYRTISVEAILKKFLLILNNSNDFYTK